VNVVNLSAHRTGAPPRQTLQQQVFVHLNVQHLRPPASLRLEHPFHKLRLRDGARKTVQDETLLAIGFADAFFHDPADHFVRNQPTSFHLGLGRQTERRLLLYGLAQDITGGNLRNRKVPGDFAGLRSLPCTRSSQENQSVGSHAIPPNA